MAERPLTNQEKRIYRAIVRGTTSAKESYRIAREAGVRRRESVLRDFRNRTLDQDTRRQMQRLGATPKEIETEVQTRGVRSARSVRRDYRPRPETFPVLEVEFPKTRYQYRGAMDVLEGNFMGKDTIPVNFGSNRRLTDREIEDRVRDIAMKSAGGYAVRLGDPFVTKKYRTRKKRQQPAEQARRAA